MMGSTMEDKCLIYQFDSFQVEPSSFRLSKDKSPLGLEPKALQLLLFLLRNKGRLLKKQELLEAVWGDASVTENALTREIALLRRVLGDDTRRPRYIETVPTQGYRFIAEVIEIRVNDSSAPQPVVAPQPNPTITERRHLLRPDARLLLPIAVLLLAGAAAVLFWMIRPNPSQGLASRAGHFQLVQLTSSDGLDCFPSFSPDGKSIAYSSDRSGTFEIYLRQSNGGEIQLTRDGAENVEPAWSPDGQWIAYHSEKNGGIWVMPTFGGSVRRLTDFGSQPSWSHSSSRIAFESGDIGAMAETVVGATPDSTIWIVDVADGHLLQLTRSTAVDTQLFGDSAPQWSPNDRQILFSGPGLGMWTIGVNGEGLKQLLPKRFAYDPVYNADGHLVYFLSADSEGYGIWEVPINPAGEATGAPVKIQGYSPGVVQYLASAGRGGQLAFSVMNTRDNLYSMNPSSSGSGEPLQLTHDTRLRKTVPSFSKDGSLIAFQVMQRGSRGGQIWTVGSDGGDAQQLPLGPFVGYPSWCGEDICYWSYSGQDQASLSRWERHAARSEGVFHTSEEMGAMRLSPDGKMLAFQRRAKDGALNIWTLSLETNRVRQLTFNQTLTGWPTWSHDGKFLAFEVKDGPNTQIVVMPSAGGAPITITHATGQSWPYSWSPDDNEIAFAGLRDGVWNIFSVSRQSGKQRQLTHYGSANTFVRYPDWSPTGHQIVYEYGASTANIWLLEPR
jgi:Tol biopolymer transport system component/DNA-binding winged helix-turn-helix (wHTH) protein